MEKPIVMHKQAVKHILRYLQELLITVWFILKKGKQEELVGYTDSYLVGRRSTGGMAFCPNGTLITWCSHKEKIVALSSCEAELMAATIEAMQALWLRNLLSEITVTPPSTLTLSSTLLESVLSEDKFR
jgi:hypothetical protein